MTNSTDDKQPNPAYLRDHELLQEYEAAASNMALSVMQRAIAEHRAVLLREKIALASGASS